MESNNSIKNKTELLRKKLQEAGYHREKTKSQLDITISKQQLQQLQLDSNTEGLASLLAWKFLLPKNICLDSLKNSFESVIKKHPILSTIYLEKNKQFYPNNIEKLDWKVFDNNETSYDIFYPIDPKIDVPMKLRVFKKNNEYIELIIVLHHIASDELSWQILLNDVSLFYNNKEDKTSLVYSNVQPYIDEDIIHISNQYWTNKLKDYFKEDQIDLFSIYRKNFNIKDTYVSTEITKKIEQKLVDQIKIVAHSLMVSPISILIATVGVLLNQRGLIGNTLIGTAVDQRESEESFHTIGNFISLLPITISTEQNDFSQLSRKIHQEIRDSFKYRFLSVEDIITELKIENTGARHPLFDFIILYRNTNRVLSIKGEDYYGEHIPVGKAIFDVMLSLDESDLSLSCEFKKHLLPIQVVEQLLEDWHTLLSSLDIIIKKKITHSIATLTDHKVKNKAQYPIDIIQQIKEWIKLNPLAEALIFQDTLLNRKELWQEVENLASYLIKIGVRSGDVVAIAVARSSLVPISFLAVLFIDAVFLPMDINQPKKRLGKFIDQSKPTLIIGSDQDVIDEIIKESHLEDLKYLFIHPHTFEVKRTYGFVEKSKNSQLILKTNEIELKGNLPAYIIFTSGTTGEPKAVLISREGLNSVIYSMRSHFDLERAHSYLALSTLGFDISIFEILAPLYYGIKLIIGKSEWVKDPSELVKKIDLIRPSIMEIIPSLLAELIKENDTVFSGIHVCCGGETLPQNLSDELIKNGAIVSNLYGPTEMSICSTQYSCQYGVLPTIGHEVPGVGSLVLDKTLKVLPDGFLGELYLFGSQIAQGYLNSSELTASYFIANPFVSGERMYRTGDLVYRDIISGELCYCGRIDSQLSIRGIRVESGEIEQSILAVSGVESAAIKIEETVDGVMIHGYYVGGIESNVVENKLKELLPGYLRPASINKIKVMPVSFNGKIDRKQLPVPNINDHTSRKPVTELEILVAKAFSVILDHKEVDATGHFFKLGGHSLKVTGLINYLEKATNIRLTPKNIFDHPMVEEIALILKNNQLGRETLKIENKKVNLKQSSDMPLTFHLSYGQKRILSAEKLLSYNGLYNMPLVLAIDGKLDVQLLSKSFLFLLNKHRILTTLYQDPLLKSANTISHSELENYWKSAFKVIHVTDNDLIEDLINKEIYCQFDLEKELPLKVIYFNGKQENHYLLMIVHHVVADEWSLHLMLNDIMIFYNQLDKGLSPISIKHESKDYIQLIDELNSFSHESYQFWQENMKGVQALEPPLSSHIANYSSVNKAEVLRLEIELQEEEIQLLHECELKYMISPLHLLQACVATVIARFVQKDVVMGIPVHGRENTDYEKVVGYFSNTLPLRISSDWQRSCQDLLIHVREVFLESLSHAEVPLEEIFIQERIPFSVLVDYRVGELPSFSTESFTAKAIEWDIRLPKFPVIILYAIQDKKHKIHLLLSREYYSEEKAQDFQKALLKTIRFFLNSPTKKIAQIDYFDIGLPDFNTNYQPYLKSESMPFKSLPDILEYSLNMYPDEPAISGMGYSMNYKTLLYIVSKIAFLLDQKLERASEENIVAIYSDNRLEQLILILSVLYLGESYIVLDANHPDDRLDKLIKQVKPTIYLTTLEEVKINKDCVDLIHIALKKMIDFEEEGFIFHRKLPKNHQSLAYTVFTSGSTGEPKGISITYEGLSDLISWGHHYFSGGKKIKMLSLAPMTFDVGAVESLIALTQGGDLYFVEDYQRAGDSLLKVILERKITHLTLTPSILETLGSPDNIPDHVLISVGSEAISSKLFNQWAKHHTMFNLYGPTECTVNAISFIAPKDFSEEIVPIGKPDIGMSAVVLDEVLQPVPIGFKGELYLGGTGLARGYITDPAQTASRFIASPFPELGSRLYRTGDIVSVQKDGNIIYHNRVDDQFKIRGLRIEPSEIEKVLLSFNKVSAAWVGLSQTSDKPVLISAISIHGVSEIEDMVLEYRDKMSDQLPQYLIPQVILAMPHLPMTQNGKVDKKKIIEQYQIIKSKKIQKNKSQEISNTLSVVVSAVAEILSIPLDKIDTHLNFLEMGGDSITSLQVIGKLKQHDIDLSPRDLFDQNSLLDLADFLDQKQKSQNSIETNISSQASRDDQGIFKPLPMAEEYLLDTKSDVLFAYYLLIDAPSDIESKIHHIATELMRRHSSFRTRYIDAKKVITLPPEHPMVNPQVMIFDEKESLDDVKNILGKFLNPFYAKNMIIGVHYLDGNKKKISFVIHHLAMDMFSWSILLDEVRKIYLGEHLTSVSYSLKDCVSIIEKREEEQFNLRKISLKNTASLLIKNFDSQQDTIKTAKNKSIIISEALTQKLQNLLNFIRNKINNQIGLDYLLVCAISRVLGKFDFLGVKIAQIELEQHGRNSIEFLNTIGWFTSIKPILCPTNGSLKDQLNYLLEQLDRENITQSINPMERSEILLNYLGKFDKNLNNTQNKNQLFMIDTSSDAVSMLYQDDMPLRNPISISAGIFSYDGKEQLKLDFLWSSRLLNHKKISEFMNAIVEELEKLSFYEQNNKEDKYIPLTYTQEGLMQLEAKDEKGKNAYIVQLILYFNGYINSHKMSQAWQEIIFKHPILSASFHGGENGYYAKREDILSNWQYLDYSHANSSSSLSELVHQLNSDMNIPFDVSQAPLCRVKMISKNSQEHALIMCLHHLLGDGWSTPIILQDLFDAYQGQLKPTEVDIATVVESVKLKVNDNVRFRWKKYLRGAKDTILVSSGHDDGERENLSWEVDSLTLSRLQKICKENKITFGSLIHVIWAKTLIEISGQNRISFGSVTAGRPSNVKGISDAVGLFSNAVPIVVDHMSRDWVSIAKQISDMLLMASENPLGLSELLQFSGYDQLFDSLLVLENYPLDFNQLTNPLPGVKMVNFEYSDGTHYPISIIINIDKIIKIRLQYAKKFKFIAPIPEVKTIFMKYLMSFLTHEISNHISFAESIRKNLIVDRLCAIPISGSTLVGEFISIDTNQCEQYLTQLARRLILLGCGAEKKVILSLPRSIESVLISIAIWKVGATLVPLDSEMDNDRYKHLVDRLDAHLIVNLHTMKRLGLDINFDLVTDEKPFNVSERLISIGLHHTAYLIHTSGTTGVPKGVCVPWSVLDNLIKWQESNLVLEDMHTIAHFAPNYFDVSIQELLTAFVFGHPLVVVSESQRKDMGELAHYLEINKVDVLFATNLVINELAAVYEQKKQPNLDYLIQAGEKLEITRSLRKWINLPYGPKLFNHYGPAETHVVTSDSEIISDSKKQTSIGHPINYVGIFILNDRLKEVELGQEGELYVMGEAVSYGYDGESALTASRFVAIPDDFNMEGLTGSRMYRTGDLAYRGQDGRIYYTGRTDDQIKIRGVRIEPNEIISILLSVKGVSSVYVIPNKASNATNMTVIIVRDQNYFSYTGEDLTEEFIHQFLSQSLPSYLQPDEVRIVDHVPLTSNNKVDKNKLIMQLKDLSTFNRTDVLRSANIKIELIKNIMSSVLEHDDFIFDNNDFFALGGHSLLATKLVNRINQAFGSNLQIKDIFELRTPERITNFIDRQAVSVSLNEIQWNRPKSKIVPSSAQLRFWALSQVMGSGHTYHLPLTVKLSFLKNKWPIDTLYNVFNRVFIELIGRHESLRTVMAIDENGPYQYVLSEKEAVSQLKPYCKKVKEKEIMKYIHEFHKTPFNLETDVMLRYGLLEIVNFDDDQSNYDAIFMITFHHICCDAWSVSILLKDIQTIFEELTQDISYTIPKATSYIDVIGKRALFWDKNKVYDKDLAYWDNQLKDLSYPMTLPLDFKRNMEVGFKGKIAKFNLGIELGQAVLSASHQLGVTPFMYLQACIALLLHKMGCGSDIVVGTPDSGRQDILEHDVMGCFINLLVLRFDLTGNPTFAELLTQVRKVTLEAYSHSSIPFDTLVKHFGSAGTTSSHPLFTVGVGLQDGSDFQFGLSGLEVSPIEYDPQVARYDLNFDFMLNQIDPQLKIFVEYMTDLFKVETIRKMIDRLVLILESVLILPKLKLSDISITLQNEKKYFYRESMQEVKVRKLRSNYINIVHGILPQNMDSSILISDSVYSLTYGELKNRTELLAGYLIQYRVKLSDFVAIQCSRSISFYVGVLAILRVGATYVPVAEEIPKERLNNIIKQSGAKIIISDLIGKKSDYTIRSLMIDEWGGLLNEKEEEKIEKTMLPPIDQLDPRLGAYVIFTSGTTGEPKGVLVNREQLSNMLDSCYGVLQPKNNECYFAFAPFGFDLAMFDILWPLSNNLEIFITSQEQRLNPELLEPIFSRYSSYISLTTPSFWSMLSSLGCHELEKQFFSGLRVVSAGEILSEHLAQKLIHQGAQVWNAYGPTEGIIISNGSLYEKGVPTLGKDLKYVRTFVLDDYLQPVPDGVLGELYIAGEQLADGYIGRSDLTASRFVANPFFNGRMYRTGDLVIRKNQQLYFQSRSDNQISIRGHRVEIDEVTVAILAELNVSDVAVKHIQNNISSILVGYIVLTDTSDIKTAMADIKLNLNHKLPEYMIPQILIPIDSIPLTANGKVNYSLLPDPIQIDDGEKAITDTEKAIATVLMDIMKIPEPNRDSGFISLGLDSISIIMLSHQLNKIGFQCSPKLIFENQSIMNLAEVLNRLPLEEENEVTSLGEKNKDSESLNRVDHKHLQSALDKWKNKRKAED